MPIDNNYNTLIERIYDSVFDPHGWDDAIGAIGAYFRSETGGFFVQTADQRLGYFRFIGMSDDDLAFYDAHIAAINPWYQIPGLMGPGKVLTDTTLEVLQKDKCAFTRSAFHAEFCGKMGLRHVIGGTLLDHRDNHLNLTFFRPRSLGNFDAEEVSAFRGISRHLAKAFELRARLQSERWLRESGEMALDRLDVGLLLVDENLGVHFSNRKAAAVLADRAVLATRAGRLRAAGDDTQRALYAAVRQLVQQGGNILVPIPRPDAAPLSAYLTAHHNATFLFPPVAARIALFLIDPDSSALSTPLQLQQQWGFTPKEAKFAHSLLQGCSIAESADRLALTRETGRWYCKRVMEKVGAHRQSELVLKLLRGALWAVDTQAAKV
jgi:DNA-binding CsgD family transcriptional regulator